MASQTGTTVLDILEIISDLRGESSTNTDANRIRAASRAERDFARRRFWRTHLLRDQTATGTGVATSFTIGSATHPMRMKGLAEVFVGSTLESARHEVVDFGTFKERYNANNADKIAYEWYDAANDVWKVRINPTPDNGATITYSYFWEPPERTLVTDVIVCPNPEIIARLALSQVYEGEDEPDKRDESLQLAEQMIDEVVGWENSPAVGQTYTFGNLAGTKGIGTY